MLETSCHKSADQSSADAECVLFIFAIWKRVFSLIMGRLNDSEYELRFPLESTDLDQVIKKGQGPKRSCDTDTGNIFLQKRYGR